jgi:hypothetical protein
MSEGIILLFRDLVTQPGESIAFHSELILEHGFCWWGWWKKPIEDVPVDLFLRMADQPREFSVRLFDTGHHKLFNATYSAIEVAGSDSMMRSPDISKTPTYYQHLKCAVWLKVTAIEEDLSASTSLQNFTYAGFPSWRTNRYAPYIDQRISSFEELDEMQVTMWHVVNHTARG